MLIVIAIAIASGLVGGWIYAGCPIPRTALGPIISSRPLTVEPPAGDPVSPAPAPGASPARP